MKFKIERRMYGKEHELLKLVDAIFCLEFLEMLQFGLKGKGKMFWIYVGGRIWILIWTVVGYNGYVGVGVGPFYGLIFLGAKPPSKSLPLGLKKQKVLIVWSFRVHGFFKFWMAGKIHFSRFLVKNGYVSWNIIIFWHYYISSMIVIWKKKLVTIQAFMFNGFIMSVMRFLTLCLDLLNIQNYVKK